ncbi:MAG: hypothetical protein Q9209_001554 [Squamulea sp. 1 TL-2023]
MSTAAATFTFRLGGPLGTQISVSMTDFVAPFANNLTFGNSTTACYFDLESCENPNAILGDSFLRSAYAVFDLEDRQIALAQSNIDANTTVAANISQITRGKNGIPEPPPTASFTAEGPAHLGSAGTAVETPTAAN